MIQFFPIHTGWEQVGKEFMDQGDDSLAGGRLFAERNQLDTLLLLF
jgi:hypothetical protein